MPLVRPVRLRNDVAVVNLKCPDDVLGWYSTLGVVRRAQIDDVHPPIPLYACCGLKITILGTSRVDHAVHKLYESRIRVKRLHCEGVADDGARDRFGKQSTQRLCFLGREDRHDLIRPS
jgi:hypothetical protein